MAVERTNLAWQIELNRRFIQFNLNNIFARGITIFDFGGVSISCQIDISGDLLELSHLIDQLYENTILFSDALHRVRVLVDQIPDAIERISAPTLFENYSFFDLRKLDLPVEIQSFLDHNSQLFGQILRCDKQELAASEVNEALNTRLSYTPHDMVVLDWNVAVSLMGNSEDIRGVLEYANIELLARISQTFPSRAGQESVKYESTQFLSGDKVLKHIEVDKKRADS